MRIFVFWMIKYQYISKLRFCRQLFRLSSFHFAWLWIRSKLYSWFFQDNFPSFYWAYFWRWPWWISKGITTLQFYNITLYFIRSIWAQFYLWSHDISHSIINCVFLGRCQRNLFSCRCTSSWCIIECLILWIIIWIIMVPFTRLWHLPRQWLGLSDI